MLNPSEQQYVTEPDGAVEWSWDRVREHYVRFIRRWVNRLDLNGDVIGVCPVYGRDPDEIHLDPEQLTHLIAEKESE